MKIKQHLPSIFTLTNLFLGFLAIINIMGGHYFIACYFILAAGAFDSVDGKIARLIGIPTNFGKEIDSLADMVSFCLAPSILVYSLYTQNMQGISGEVIASAPLFMGAIRLARFNSEASLAVTTHSFSILSHGKPCAFCEISPSEFYIGKAKYTSTAWYHFLYGSI